MDEVAERVAKTNSELMEELIDKGIKLGRRCLLMELLTDVNIRCANSALDIVQILKAKLEEENK